MLTELTPDQIAQLDIYAEKWRAIGLSTEPVNRSEAEHAIEQYYQQVHGCRLARTRTHKIWCTLL